ncbi:NLR family CARD domain-containing protein 4 [Holothuria leucospilota]|uniref:NLR family CARD domain-containing protein 4 n=1 Tax=Holothuria leucospilota TaxID=206669 RepID=A0A9Q0YAP0_HOLLE|nr:NLR family CARD domain-containing protein 4 [Holothuria leucospilota]
MASSYGATVICFLLFVNQGAGIKDECPPIQYLVLGTTGIIHCSFQEGFFGVLWYNTTDVSYHDAILTVSEGEKSGTGYLAGEYDVFANGSLVVYNVSKWHESKFTMLLLKSTSDLPVRYNFNVFVNAKTFIPFPRVNECSNISEVCLQSWDQLSETSCYIRDARLMIPLTWMVRTIRGDRNISSVLSVTNRTSFYTSKVSTTNPFAFSSRLALLVCKADDPVGLLKRNQSLVLVSKQKLDHSSETVITKYLKIGSEIRLECSANQFLFLLWQVKQTLQDKEIPIIYAVLKDDAFSLRYDDDYNLESNGSLAVYDVTVKHGGLYSCISGDGITDNAMLYNIVVFVLPVPPYPVIQGCNHEQYCVLEVQREGSLTCTLTGIRPRVQLDLKAFNHQLSQGIEFFDKQLLTNDNDGTFDVSLTSQYRVTETEINKVTIDCRVIGTEIDHLQLATKFDILFISVETEKSQSTGQLWILFVVITIVIISMVACGIIILVRVFWKRQGISRYNITESRIHEINDIHHQTINTEEVLPMLEQMSLKDKQHLFITSLKSKYQDLYDAVQPIPYIRDRLYCVDRVFVEGGIEFLVSKDTIGSHGTWQTLDTYQNILNDPRVKSVRRILEGEPGYGKSTLTLQFTYDWCNKIPASSLCNVHILIFLRLRQLGGVSSIFRAIKQFLLPKDTILTVTDIEDIIRSCSSVVVLLDGFDEYPDQDGGNDCDVINIITKNMFQQFEVILTTRSSYLPKVYPPQTKRIKLTGFDDRARDQYIRKAVVGDNNKEAADIIKRRLKENVILAGLCQVPLFFVMFAHMSHESEYFQKFNSVTSFFRYMITCFHSHMKNKMKDENVRQFDLFETEHKELDRLAFEGLNKKHQQIVWMKEDICKQTGDEFYQQYVNIGILVEEQVLQISNDSTSPVSDHIQYTTEVRFYHKLFCEWYAAHYLAEYASREEVTFNEWDGLPVADDSSSNDSDVLSSDDNADDEDRVSTDGSYPSTEDHFLKYLNPADLQYVYRFASGLNPAAGEKLINYLKGDEEGERFAILCILEQGGKVENVLSTVEELCSDEVTINVNDSLLMQSSTLQLLEIASSNGATYYKNCSTFVW